MDSEDVDHIVFQTISLCNQFLFLINIHILDYPQDPRLSGLFRLVPMSLDNRGLTVL